MMKVVFMIKTEVQKREKKWNDTFMQYLCIDVKYTKYMKGSMSLSQDLKHHTSKNPTSKVIKIFPIRVTAWA